MKVLFVIPKNKLTVFGYRGVAPSFPHLGVAYLIAMLQRESIEVKLFDDASGQTHDDLFKLIQNFKPDLIGITIFTSFSRNFAYELIQKIKDNSDIPVVVGGVHVSTIKRLILEETKTDFAIKYEGEYPLIELINELKSSKPQFEMIKNLIWRSDGQIIENPARPFITDLDQLPFPQFDLYDIKVHFYPGVPEQEMVIPLISSRGCPFECNFCSVRLHMGGVFRKRSQQNVFQELKYRYDRGFSQFDFNDDCFTLDKKRTEQILNMIIDSGLKIKFQFYIGIRVDTVDPDLLRKLKKAGCFFICYGVESGNDEVLKNIEKGFTMQQIRDAVNWTNEAGIANAVNFIIGHKGETYQTALDSISLAKSLPTNIVNFFNLVPYPGTEAFEWAKKNGRFLLDTNNYLQEISYFENRPIFQTKEFTKKEREKITRMGFNLSEHTVLRHRFGKHIGTLLFFLTRNRFVKIYLVRFVATNKVGRKLAALLSGRLCKSR